MKSFNMDISELTTCALITLLSVVVLVTGPCSGYYRNNPAAKSLTAAAKHLPGGEIAASIGSKRFRKSASTSFYRNTGDVIPAASQSENLSEMGVTSLAAVAASAAHSAAVEASKASNSAQLAAKLVSIVAGSMGSAAGSAAEEAAKTATAAANKARRAAFSSLSAASDLSNRYLSRNGYIAWGIPHRFSVAGEYEPELSWGSIG
ncbi:uncharacterized protein [Periplaneta americana]|uniref:uncharacterized protein n=1 Tax=Periplaneta americana TaxID=6978 RepID=UPI0037E75219